ncbi:MAG: dihydroneopterin triphosphate diphosphatase [Dechloromonas sp.]|nr:MAG: dihydroneopterin triphosphate diphosphatase [Dechloromonas sp.]
MTAYKTPVSVLVVIYTVAGEFLLIERAAHPGYWQSVTGSLEATDADLATTARREVFEETGIPPELGNLTDWRLSNRYEIFPEWRHRYAPGVTTNTEHLFSLSLPNRTDIRLAENEHRAAVWLAADDAAARCFSWSNRDAIRLIQRHLAD